MESKVYSSRAMPGPLKAEGLCNCVCGESGGRLAGRDKAVRALGSEVDQKLGSVHMGVGSSFCSSSCCSHLLFSQILSPWGKPNLKSST